MSFSQFLPRRISAEGCKAAGTQLATNLAALKQDGAVLPPEIEASAKQVAQATDTIALITGGDDATMREIDRAADATLSAYHDNLESRSRIYLHTDIVPASDEQQKIATASQALLQLLFKDGVAPIVQAPYHVQWANLAAIKTALSKSTNEEKIKSLGLVADTAYLVSWIDLYGRRLGITEAKPEEIDPIAKASAAWHEAYGEFFVEVTRAFRNEQDPTHARYKQLLTEPYQSIAAYERNAASQTRKKQNKATGQ